MLNNASAATVQAPPYTSERQRTLATLVVSIALVLEIIDVSIINVAIPVVQRDLLASPRQIEWVVTGYLFFFSILLLTGGRLGDLYGYRRLFISGLLAFGAASAGCGLAASPEMLVAMRIAQGASGAMMGPQILSLMQVLYRPHERFRVMSIFGLLGGAAGILGPVLGGIIIESNLFGLSWRPIFLINVPVIAIAVALAWRVLPAVRSPEAKGIDPLGTLLAVVGGGALLLTLIEGPALRWPAWMVLPPLLSVITMFLSTHISMKASGQQMQGSMKLTMYMMPLMYLFFCFTYPLAFSLYYVISNIVMTAQTQVMRKFYDPEKMRKDVEAEIAAKRKQEKRGVKNTTVTVTDPKTGKAVEKNLSASEMNKRRLEYARQLDAERYKDERTVPLSELDKQDKQ